MFKNALSITYQNRCISDNDKNYMTNSTIFLMLNNILWILL